MFTIGITKGRWNTWSPPLQQFGRTTTTTNQPCGRCCPSSCKSTMRYERVGLRTRAPRSTGWAKQNDVARLTTEMYLSDMIPPCARPTPSPGWPTGEIERVPVDDLEGRVTAVLLTPIRRASSSFPGNASTPRFATTPFARAFNASFPGFENRHPRPGQGEDGRYYVDCVR